MVVGKTAGAGTSRTEGSPVGEQRAERTNRKGPHGNGDGQGEGSRGRIPGEEKVKDISGDAKGDSGGQKPKGKVKATYVQGFNPLMGRWGVKWGR